MTSAGRPAGSAEPRLARLGFTRPAAALQLLHDPALGLWDDERNAPADDTAAAVVAALGRVADPDGALAGLAAVATAQPELRPALGSSPRLRARLLSLLGTSTALRGQLEREPGDWSVLAEPPDPATAGRRLAAAVGADPDRPVTGWPAAPAALSGAAAMEALRAAYRRELIAIAGQDLAGELDFDELTAQLADLAAHVLQAALAVAAAEVGDRGTPCRLAVIAMGKTGGRELNYVSDVDVVFVAEPVGDAGTDAALTTAAQLASAMMRLCRPVAWAVDANLRPEGKDGPLVRTLASHQAYYQRWASTWEFQALLKARPIAGDCDLGRDYLTAISPLVWTAAERPDFVEDVRAMRRRVLAHVPPELVERELKLGIGGLRDVEFAVQLLQLVHGRGDETLRLPGTLPALAALRDGGYVGRDDALSLRDAYVFLRTAEHRLQLHRLRRTHLLPDDEGELQWLARSMGFRPDHRGDARDVWAAERALHTREVRRLHEKLFYRPLLEAVARVPAAALRLTPDEAGRRLAALGFADPAAALRHIDALTAGISRRASLQRTLLPVLLSDLADAPDPDGGLLAYRQVSEALGQSPWYLRLLRDEGSVASRLAYVLGTSRYVTRMLGRAPEALRLLADDAELAQPDRADLTATMIEAAARQPADADAVQVIRGLRRTELLRCAFADLLDRADVVEVCAAISASTEATLEAALQVARASVAAELGVQRLPLQFAVIAMGRLGGAEVGYGSDADVMFVYDAIPDSDDGVDVARAAQDIAVRLRSLLAAPSAADPPLVLDADLRPEGRNGPLVRTLAAYRAYYARWSAVWEAQALLRARFAAGDAELGERFTAVIDPIRYPARVGPADVLEIRRLKGRVDAERLPRGADPTNHAKLGRGGLADIEWTVQLLQLCHGHAIAGLRTTGTLAALAAARDADLLTAAQHDALQAAWRQSTAVRNAVMLAQDKPGDELPHPGVQRGIALRAVGRILGYPTGFDPGRVLDDYRRTTRRARRVVEQVFYG